MILIEAVRVDKSLCLPKLKSITALLYDFSTMNEHCLFEVLFNLKTFSQVLVTVIKLF